MDDFRPLGIVGWIDPEDDQDGLAPIGTFGIGVQKPDIRCQMPLVIRIDALSLGRMVIEGRDCHCGQMLKRWHFRDLWRSGPLALSTGYSPQRIAWSGMRIAYKNIDPAMRIM
ncbi:hypothetical protein [Acidocella facilis]